MLWSRRGRRCWLFWGISGLGYTLESHAGSTPGFQSLCLGGTLPAGDGSVQPGWQLLWLPLMMRCLCAKVAPVKYRVWLCRSGVGVGILCFQVEPEPCWCCWSHLSSKDLAGSSRQAPHTLLPLDMDDAGLLPSEGLHGDQHTLPLTPIDWFSGTDGHEMHVRHRRLGSWESYFQAHALPMCTGIPRSLWASAGPLQYIKSTVLPVRLLSLICKKTQHLQSAIKWSLPALVFHKLSFIDYKEGHFIMIKSSIHQEGVTVVNMYAPNISTPKYTKQKLTKMKGK